MTGWWRDGTGDVRLLRCRLPHPDTQVRADMVLMVAVQAVQRQRERSGVMPGVLVVLLWLAAGGVATWLIGREEIRRVERRAESPSRDKVKP